MRGLPSLAVVLAVAGVVAFAVGASRGEVQVALVVILPVVVGTGPWAFLGAALLMAAAVAGFGGLSRRLVPEPAQVRWSHVAKGETRTEEWPAPEHRDERPPRDAAGGFVLIGPFPVAFGSTKALAVSMLLAALLLLALVLLLPALMGGLR